MIKKGLDRFAGRVRKSLAPQAPRATVILYGYRVLNAFVCQQTTRTTTCYATPPPPSPPPPAAFVWVCLLAICLPFCYSRFFFFFFCRYERGIFLLPRDNSFYRYLGSLSLYIGVGYYFVLLRAGIESRELSGEINDRQRRFQFGKRTFLAARRSSHPDRC